jgi:aldehyde:ferredoxin oxidoreductase
MKNHNGNLPTGYMGKILTVDMSKHEYRQDPLEPRLTDRVFGGRGLGVALVIDHFLSLEKKQRHRNAFRDVAPLSEENVLVFTTSPLTGTGAPTSGRLHATFKSPLTDGIGSANSGGHWAVAFKKTGHDVLRIVGRSDRPVFLSISSRGVEFLDGDELMELNVEEITQKLLKKAPKGARVMTIGEAGRKLSRMASIMNDRGRALGRGGGGAVFGSKNLMAIVACPDPSLSIEAAHPEGLRSGNVEGAGFKAKIKMDVGKMTRREKNYGILPSMGTLGLLGMVAAFDELIHNNMRDTRHRPEDVDRISGEAMRHHAVITKSDEDHVEVKKGACYSCPITCTRVTKIRDSRGKVRDQGEGPEFETVTLLGANLSIYDLVAIAEANYWANRYGLDTISLGGTIAALFELYEIVTAKKGSLTPKEKQFLEEIQDFVGAHGEPRFGRKEVLLPLVHAIGRSEGIGKALAEGSYRFCQRYGHEELSMTVKRLELPAYDPRATFIQALCYEMCNRGGCHLENGYTAIRAYCAGYAEWPGERIEGTALVARNSALANTVMDIIGACAFSSLALTLDEFAALVNAVTGLSHNAGTLQRIAWRTLTLERIFNTLAGVTSKDDWLPDRFYEETIEVEGHEVKCDRDAFSQMHTEYYRAMGWDEEGIPEKATLDELDLADLLDDRLSKAREQPDHQESDRYVKANRYNRNPQEDLYPRCSGPAG